MEGPTTNLRDKAEHRPAAWSRWGLAALATAAVLSLAQWSPWRKGSQSTTGDDSRRSTSVTSQDGSSDRPAATVEEIEPNDTAGEAQRLDIDSVVGAHLATPSDVDIYRVEFPVAAAPGDNRSAREERRIVGVLDARMFGRSGLRLRVTGSDGTQRAAVSAPDSLSGYVFEEPDIWLAVDGGEDTGSEAGDEGDPYRLVVRARTVELVVDREPNDDPEHAEPAEVQVAKRAAVVRRPNLGVAAATPSAPRDALLRYRARGWWSEPGDVDCFGLPMRDPPAGALLRVEVAPPRGVTPRVEVWSTSGTLLTGATATASGSPVVIPDLAVRSWEPGVVACVRPADSEHPTLGYVLRGRVWMPEERFEFEPNDTRATATPLPLDIELHAYAGGGDVDWYHVSAAPSPVRVYVDASPGLSVRVTVFDRGAGAPAAAEAKAGAALEIEHDHAGLVRVRAASAGATTEPLRYAIVARRQDTESGTER